MRSLTFLPLSVVLGAIPSCAVDSEPLPVELEEDVQPRSVGAQVRPDFEFRFSAAMPTHLDRAAANAASYSLTQELPVGTVQITGTVGYDPTTRVATFTPDTDLDALYPYDGGVTADLAPYLQGLPDTIQAPCISDDIDVVIDNVPYSDGIPNCREQEGWWYHGQPLAAWGASPDQLDIFIEVDYYDANDPSNPGGTPQKRALERLREAFLAEGYHVHFDVGDLYSNTYPDLDDFNLGGGDPMGSAQGDVPLPAGGNLRMIAVDPTGSCPGNGVYTNLEPDNFISLYRRQHFTPGREFSFYYFVFVTEVNGNQAGAQIAGTNAAFPFGHAAWTGIFDAQLGETTIADHLADPARSLLDPDCKHPFCNQIVNYQAGTMMHEFGHNLGLLHHTGGPGTISEHTPNYWSVMSYQYQIFGLPPDPATYEGDRFFFANATKCTNQAHPTAKSELVRGPLSSWDINDPDHFLIDYSHGDNPCIEEGVTVENDGVNGFNGGNDPFIDWNCNNANDGGPADLNGDGDTTDTLCDNDDWATIELYHAYWDAQGGALPNDGLPYPCPLDSD